MKNKIKKVSYSIILILVTVTVFSFVMLYISPKPIFILAKHLTTRGTITKPENFKQIEKRTIVEKNVIYDREYTNSLLDIYYPKESTEKIPVVLYIHGGGFIKGNKEMAKYFGPVFVEDKYAFISLNYDLVPSVTIFDQLKQINQSLKFIVENADKYSLNVNKINIAGSSAGGFLALQLLSAYNNHSYANSLNINLVDNVTFNSILLYSSVYDLSAFQNFEEQPLDKYLINKVGWGITGDKYWEKNIWINETLNLNNYISEKFPPMFITDGNQNTFLKQALTYIDGLQIKGIVPTTLFFDSNERVEHGYQLNMESKFSKEAIRQSLSFLKKYE